MYETTAFDPKIGGTLKKGNIYETTFKGMHAKTRNSECYVFHHETLGYIFINKTYNSRLILENEPKKGDTVNVVLLNEDITKLSFGLVVSIK